MQLRLLLACVLLALVAAPLAAADRVYHSEHMDLMRVGTDPLHKGFVQNIHPNGPNVYAHEIYVLNGALPTAAYTVHLLVHLFSPTCAGAPTQFAVTPLTTNRSGNGQADLFIRPPIPAPIRDATHGVRWEVRRNGVLQYATACTPVMLD
jgi:hypothetical protein